MATISIGQLERSAKVLKKQLEAEGFKVTLDTFRTGPGGVEHYGPSTVGMMIEKGELWESVTFISGGYAATGTHYIGDGMKWSEMREKALEIFRAAN